MPVKIFGLLVCLVGPGVLLAEAGSEMEPLSLEFLDFLVDFAEEELVLDVWLAEQSDDRPDFVRDKSKGVNDD